MKRKDREILIVLSIIVLGIVILVMISTQLKLVVPSPTQMCDSELSWQGIIPGKSTEADVRRILGAPTWTGYEHQVKGYFSRYFSYQVTDGNMASNFFDRIHFMPNGVVDKIEIIIADREGIFTSYEKSILEIGSTIDFVFFSNNYKSGSGQYDVLVGADQILVSAKCGIAYDVLPYCYPSSGNSAKCYDEQLLSNDTTKVTVLFPSPFQIGTEPKPDVHNILLKVFLFQPTTTEYFQKNFMGDFTYGVWDGYLRSINWFKDRQ